jgi:predicted phage terminase large subunit-like protein
LFERASRETVHALVSFPPRHAKSTTVRRALAWSIRRYPERLNGLVMYAAPAAQAQSRLVRKLVRQEGVTLEPDAQNVGLWMTPQGGGLAATGINGQLTGKGFGGIMVLDDPLKGREQAESPRQREKAWETFTDDAFTRLEPPCGSCIIVATRWHEDDITGRLLERMGSDEFPTFEVVNLPAIRDPATNEPSSDGIALWPERFPFEKLAPIRATLGPYGWWSLYQGEPRPKGGRVFGDPARYVEPARDGARIVLSVDAAGTEGTHSDYTAAIALAVKGRDAQMTTDVLEVARWRLEPQKTAALLRAFQLRHGGGSLVIESTRDGKAIAKALRAIDPNLLIHEVPPIGDKFTRAQPVAAAWNQSRVRVPMHAPWLADFLVETSKFTGLGDAHDDQCDALAHGWNYAVQSYPASATDDSPLNDY